MRAVGCWITYQPVVKVVLAGGRIVGLLVDCWDGDGNDPGRREKKTSNAGWTHPQDPDARVTKMKDSRTHLAHKAEEAADLETGAVLVLTVQGADTPVASRSAHPPYGNLAQ